jgi:hypothetical protein
MATLSKGYTFGATEQVTAAKLHSLVDSASIASIVAADITDGTITDAKMASVGGAKLLTLGSTPAGAGLLPSANVNFTGIATDMYNTAWTDYSSTSTVVGWASFTTKSIYYKKVGKLVFLSVYLNGESNSALATITVPNGPSVQADFSIFAADGGVYTAGGGAGNVSSSTAYFYKDMAFTAFTASGNKIVRGQCWWEAAS